MEAITFPQADLVSGGSQGDGPRAWERGWEASQGRLWLCLVDTPSPINTHHNSSAAKCQTVWIACGYPVRMNGFASPPLKMMTPFENRRSRICPQTS